MAIHGVNLAERADYILTDDPGHPDNVKKEAERRISSSNAYENLDAAIAAVEAEPDYRPTVFQIGNLTDGDRVELGDMTASPSMKDGEIRMNNQRVRKAYEVVRRGLKGWENMLSASGETVPFEKETHRSGAGSFNEAVSAKCMLHLPQLAIVELSGAILDKNGMRTALEKKFDGALPQLDDLNFGIGDAPNAAPPNKPNEDAPNPPNVGSEEATTGHSPMAPTSSNAQGDT